MEEQATGPRRARRNPNTHEGRRPNTRPIIFQIDYDRYAFSTCKRCRKRIRPWQLRMAKLSSRVTYSEIGNRVALMRFYHPKCLFIRMKHSAARKIHSVKQIRGFHKIRKRDQRAVRRLVKNFWKAEERRQRIFARRKKARVARGNKLRSRRRYLRRMERQGVIQFVAPGVQPGWTPGWGQQGYYQTGLEYPDAVIAELDGEDEEDWGI